MRIDDFNVFEFDHPRVALLSYLDTRQAEDSSFSVRKWSKEMGFKTHSMVSFLLQGKRKIGLQHIDKFAETMSLTDSEKKYLKGITLLSKTDNEDERLYHLIELAKYSPERYLKSKRINKFKIIADWYHMAIMALTDVEGESLTEVKIRLYLGNKVSSTQLAEAVERLIDLGLLKRNNEFLLSDYDASFTTNDIPDEGIKEYHRQTCDLAKQAVDEVDLLNREFQSFSMAMFKENISVAKEIIRKFKEEFCLSLGGQGDNIYQMNIQFFQLSCYPDSPGVKDFAPDSNKQKTKGETNENLNL